MDENYIFVVFRVVNEWKNEWGDILINCPNCLFGTKVINTLLFDNCYWFNYNVIKKLQKILILGHVFHLYLAQHFFCTS